MTREAEASTDLSQRKLIEELQERGHEWLPRSSAQGVAQIIAQKLKPRPDVSTTETSGRDPHVYLLCDPTTPSDAAYAADIQKKILAEEHMVVELSSTPQLTTDHDRLLRGADGLLLYRSEAPERWLYRTAEHVIHAERLVRRETPFRSKGLLLAEPTALPEAGVPLFRPSMPFRLNDIEPFLAPLRRRGTRGA